MSHRCVIGESSVVCFEESNTLWVKELYEWNCIEKGGKAYQVNFCPICGFTIPKASFAKRLFGRFGRPDVTPDDSITQFSQSLSTAIAQMNYNVELIKAFMSSQNSQNECFMDREMCISKEIDYLKRRIEILEEK